MEGVEVVGPSVDLIVGEAVMADAEVEDAVPVVAETETEVEDAVPVVDPAVGVVVAGVAEIKVSPTIMVDGDQ